MDMASGIATAIRSGCKFSHLSAYVQTSNTENLLSTCITQQKRSSLNAIIILFYLPHLQRIMSFKVQHRECIF